MFHARTFGARGSRHFSWLAAALGVALLGVAGTIPGTFALQGGTAKTHGYLRASTIASNPLAQHLDIWMTPANSRAPIAHYTVDMTKLLHLIVVSDDFRQFLHVHPVLADGHFTIDQTFPVAGLYHAYADGEPAGIGQQVFRFDLPVGRFAPAHRDLTPTGRTVAAGPYTVTLSGTTLRAGHDSQLTVHIAHGGKPAGDLHPFLGALAHAVFLNGTDLSYMHVHPMPLGMAGMGGMDGMPGMTMTPLPDTAISAPDMVLTVHLKKAGIYGFWLQFRGGSALRVARFIVSAN